MAQTGTRRDRRRRRDVVRQPLASHRPDDPSRTGRRARLARRLPAPDVVDAYAGQLAAAGRVADLRAALAVTKRTLRLRRGSTHDAWQRSKPGPVSSNGSSVASTAARPDASTPTATPSPSAATTPKRPTAPTEPASSETHRPPP